MAFPIRPSSIVRALGTAHAVAVAPRDRVRLLTTLGVVAGTDVAARRINPVGLALVTIKPDRGTTWSTEKHIASEALTVAAWVGGNLLLGRLLRRLPVPDLAVGLLTGAGIAALDTAFADHFEPLVAPRPLATEH